MYTIPEITLWKAGECWKGTAVHIVPVFGLRGPVTEDGLRHHESNLEGNQLVRIRRHHVGQWRHKSQPRSLTTKLGIST
jgi:hypothetical protein